MTLSAADRLDILDLIGRADAFATRRVGHGSALRGHAVGAIVRSVS